MNALLITVYNCSAFPYNTSLEKSFNLELWIFENIKNTCSTENSKQYLDRKKGEGYSEVVLMIN